MKLPVKLMEEVKLYFEENKIPKDKQDDIMEKVKAIYKKTTYDQEEPIGVVTAQSLSEPATQMTMRTYHFAGTAGIQRLILVPERHRPEVGQQDHRSRRNDP